MPTPEKHALLSASSASRWLICTAAPRFEEQFPETTSAHAEHGRIAHEMGELKVLKKFTCTISPRTYSTRLNKLIKKEKDFVEAHNAQHPESKLEISGDTFTNVYLDHLTEKAMTYDRPPSVSAEVMVDYSEYAPEGFGTCDCIMIGGDTLDITDYKHGKGVPISAENNAQMKLYALGALKRYRPIYGDTIKRVRMTICQPRIQDEPSTEMLATEELIAWGTSIKPIAQKAYIGFGDFVPGEHCRFCRGKAQCRARADQNIALEEFKNCVPQNGAKPPMFGQGVLTDDEIGDLLIRGKELVQWYKDLEEYALNALLNGWQIPGWKAVAGRSNRAFTDQDAAIAAVLAAGYNEALVYERKPKTLTELEKLMGKTEFTDKLGSFIIKPLGKPTLAPLTDKREPYNPAAADFAEVGNE